MNDMELLRELAQETPLPALSELDAARSRLVAAIGTEPAAGRFASIPEVAKNQPNPSRVEPVEPLRPPAPAAVRDAVKLMYGGAVGTAVQLIITLAFVGDTRDYNLTVLRHHLTTAQITQWRPLIITLVIVASLALIAGWLGMARAVGQGRSWARILSTVLLGLATLELAGLPHGFAQVFPAVLTWLTGLAAVWLLWRPTSSAFFRQSRQSALTRQR